MRRYLNLDEETEMGMRLNRFWMAGLASAALMFLPAHAASEKDQKVGKTLVAEYIVPADTVAKFNAFVAAPPKMGEAPVMNVLMAEGEKWSGPQFRANSTTNPYRIAVTISGVVPASGGVATMWQAGWNLSDGEGRIAAFPGLTNSTLKAGDHVTLTSATAPMSFKEDRDVAVMLALVNARGFKFDSVRVQVWSGIPSASWHEMILSLPGLLTGIVMLLLFWWFRRR
jgi:hypothetical protein